MWLEPKTSRLWVKNLSTELEILPNDKIVNKSKLKAFQNDTYIVDLII